MSPVIEDSDTQPRISGKNPGARFLGRRLADLAASRGALAAGTLLAHGPVLAWLVRRLDDGGDEPWGVVALILALLTTPRTTWGACLGQRTVVALAGAVGTLILTAGLLPWLVRAGLMMGLLALILNQGRGALARGVLLTLSLPTMASLQFYAGYPLRVVAAELGRGVVALGGVATERRGTCLAWDGGEVWVDAPCSGLNMLWTATLLAAATAAWIRLPWRRTLGLLALTTAGVILLNGVRVGLLFFVESGLWRMPEGFHAGMACGLFLILAAGVLAGASRLARNLPPAPDDMTAAPIAARGLGVTVAWVTLAAFALAPLGRALDRVTPGTEVSAERFPGWPELFEGRPWIREPDELGLAAVLGPVRMATAVFRQENRRVVLSWIPSPSRKVHALADCFRARGYRVDTARLVRDAQGTTWSECRVERGEERWRLRARLHGTNAGDWTDVSAWYWAAWIRPDEGPWWAVTVIEPATG